MTTMPTWDQLMVPVLRVLADGQVRQIRELHVLVADAVGLTEEQRAETLPTGDLRYTNRIGWAASALARSEALDRPTRGHYQINELGRAWLAEYPSGISEKQMQALLSPAAGKATAGRATAEAAAPPDLDPVEQVENGVARIHADVAAELLARLHAQDPAFFEQAVLDLLVAMGYGGGDRAVTRTQLSNDGGIDGIIDQDVLGLARVYVQAKRYKLDASVGRPEIQAFVGALHGNQATQGVFLTTGRYSAGAREYAEAVSTRVVLIDGRRLADLMIRYRVGVQPKRTVTIVEIDEDFFE